MVPPQLQHFVSSVGCLDWSHPSCSPLPRHRYRFAAAPNCLDWYHPSCSWLSFRIPAGLHAFSRSMPTIIVTTQPNISIFPQYDSYVFRPRTVNSKVPRIYGGLARWLALVFLQRYRYPSRHFRIFGPQDDLKDPVMTHMPHPTQHLPCIPSASYLLSWPDQGWSGFSFPWIMWAPDCVRDHI